MGNYLKMDKKNLIIALDSLGWSYRRIERETGVRRETISKYVNPKDSKPAISPTGSPGQNSSPGRPCLARAYHQQIEEAWRQGLSAQRIYQDLCAQYGYPGGYDSVKRYLRTLRPSSPEVFARIETLPGEEAQVDFGKGAPTLHPIHGTFRRPYLFVMTLSCSRHSYEETVWHQDAQTFVRLHERAFQAFGGVPATIRLDNLKAGVTRACFYEPQLNTLYASFARHAGFTPLPCRVATPQHKGKVERNVGYTQDNALKGRRFESLEEQNAYLRHWNKTVACLRIHGSTKEQVWARFERIERQALKPLPDTAFQFFSFGTRKVHVDGHIEVNKAFYSVPHTCLGRDVEVQWDDRLLRVYLDQRLIAVHKIAPQGGLFTTQREHLPPHKNLRQDGHQRLLLAKARHIGTAASFWTQQVLETRGPLAFRLIQGMLSLTRSYPKEQLNRACSITLRHKVFSYRALKSILARLHEAPSPDSSLTQDHELIRPLSHYAQLFKTTEEPS